jgi:hypothetical protein
MDAGDPPPLSRAPPLEGGAEGIASFDTDLDGIEGVLRIEP